MIRNPISTANQPGSREAIIDIRAEAVTGQWFTIEVQLQNKKDFRQRSLYYWARTFTEQLQSGDDYDLLQPTVGINLLQFPIIRGHRRVHYTFRPVDLLDGTPVVLSDHLTLHFLDASALSGEDRDTILRSEMFRWLWFLSATGNKREDPEMREIINEIIAREPELAHVARRYEEILSDPALREEIEAREKARRDRVAEYKLAEEQGEEKAKLEIARRMLAGGHTIPAVVSITGLNEQRVTELQAEGSAESSGPPPAGAG